MNKKINVTGSSESGSVPVRRRNTQGRQVETISFSTPKELNQRINGIVAKTAESRSKVISDLIEDGFELRERKGK